MEDEVYSQIESEFPTFFVNGKKAADFIEGRFFKDENGRIVLGGFLKDGLPENIKEAFMKNYGRE